MTEATDHGSQYGQRAAAPGELCTCGRPAVTVYTGGDLGPSGDCGLRDGGAPTDGVCTFCGDAVDHEHYARSEQAAGRPYTAYWPSTPQGERCPLYRLRLADPLPELHTESVRRYDAAVDRAEHAQARLEQEVLHTLLAAGLPFDGVYQMVADLDPDEPSEYDHGDLGEVAWDIAYNVARVLRHDEDDPAGHDPDAGHSAVAVLMLGLRARLEAAGVTPNPLAGLDDAELVARAGGADTWAATVAHDRPLLIARRVVRRALDPEVPDDIYRPWFT